MPFQSSKPKLTVTQELHSTLTDISNSRTEPFARVERAKILLGYLDGLSISAIAADMRTNRVKVNACVNKAIRLGIPAALDDLRRTGRPRSITEEDRLWLISLACQKPIDLGYSYELWTHDLLAKHIRENCTEAGHESLSRVASGTISKILEQHCIKPHKIKYFLERRDPDFEAKMAEVLCVYQEIAIKLDSNDTETYEGPIVISYDEKPGIQAIECTTPDRMPVPGEYPCMGRDYEYVRHGTVSLLAGIDLMTGIVHGIVEERHRSSEFIKFLQLLDQDYPDSQRLRLILDNHSAHISKETQKYLATVPNRFEFIFTPKHGSWLNIIEVFFAKMTKQVLHGIRVSSIDDLKERILLYLKEVNQFPTIFRWKYGMKSKKIYSNEEIF